MKLKLVSALIVMTIASVAHASGVQLSRTRLLLEDGASKVTYGLSNNGNTPVLASATISNFDGSATEDFAVSPSLYQVQPQKTHNGQIVLLKQLPIDRESVYWLTVKTVTPESEKNAQASSMQIAIAQSIKVFYRPKGLDENTKTGLKNLHWQVTSTGIKAKNGSKVSFSIVNVKDTNDRIHKIADVVLPKSDKEWKIDNKGLQIRSFTYVDEYGNYLEQPIHN